MNNFIESLSFKHKIIFGFTLLSVILILGMGYMLLQFNKISQLSNNIIDIQQPITSSASSAIEHSKSAVNHIHKYLLSSTQDNLENYSKTIADLKNVLRILSVYAEIPQFKLNITELKRIEEIIRQLDYLVRMIQGYNQSFEENHPVINKAASVLNPLALEYLGILNNIIEENTNTGLPKKAMLMISDLRHSWTQMMSSLRISLATRQEREFINVRAYADVNLKQMNEIKRLNLDLGLVGIEDLKEIRDKYMVHLEETIANFNAKIWRMDAHIMTAKVMPLFDEMNLYLDNIYQHQTKQFDIADNLLAKQLKISHYSYVVLIIISFIIAFFIAVFITRSLRRPLLQLVDASNEVAKGNFDTSIPVKGDDEIAYLSRTFNKMVQQLQKSQHELMNARDVAENANKVKSEFLTRMSHELRTPLNAILGFAQILDIELTKDGSSQSKQHIDKILKSGVHLLDLVEELLDLSQIESNTIPIHKQAKNILPLIDECIDISRSMAEDSEIQVIDNLDKDISCYVYLDPVRFKQVMINFLTNAIKFNRKQGRVTVERVLLNDNTIKISVCDEGKGLSENEQHDVFDAFQRLDADKQSISGVGVGLNIAKKLVELMDGKIGVNSEKGVGSCFWVEFQLTTAPGISEEVSHQQAIESVKTKTDKDESEYNVLYIEDDEFNMELVQDILSVMLPEINLYEAENAEDGLEIISEEDIDLVLMDINLPGMSGYDALYKIKDNPGTEHIPVIAVSADAVKESVNKGKNHGFINYITKPINIEDFVDVISSTLDNT